MSEIKPPIVFAAKDAKFVSTFPDGSDQLWKADVKDDEQTDTRASRSVQRARLR